MSRSYKRNPISKDGGKSSKSAKQLANRRLRRKNNFDIKRSNYKKTYEQWDINDYISRWTLEDAINDWHEEESNPKKNQWIHNRFKTLEEWINHWKKCMYRK